MNVPAPRHVHGVSVVPILVAIAIIVGIAAAAWFLIVRPHHTAIVADQPTVQTGKRPVKKATPPPVNVASMSTAQLLSEASKAIKEQRLLAPQDNNAFEFYLKVLDRQPDNQVAKDALRETFPFAANAAEQVINQGNFGEAEREIALLAKADPDNYTLTILRSKLDARRRVRVAQRQQRAAQLAAQKQQAAEAATQARQDQLAKQHAAQLAAQQAAADKAALAKAPARKRANATKPQPASPPTPKVNIQGAVLVKQVKADYPPAANRARRQGWVIVQYTVGKDGKVHDAHVIDAHPVHIFDHSAIRAVSGYVYKPALRNGKPMAVTMTKKFNFTLGNG